MKNLHVKIYSRIKKVIGNFVPDVGVVLGSGWGDVVDLVQNKIVIPYDSIKGMPKPTVAGHAGNLIFGSLHGKNVVFVQGRFHIYEGHKIETVVMMVRILKLLGISKLIITNAAGGVNEKYDVGDIVVIKDQINYTGINPLIGLKPTPDMPVFVDLTYPYDLEYSQLAHLICSEKNIPVHYGTYFQFTGPSYETPSEIKMVRALGGDLVGMSTAVEVVMANYEKIRTVGISCVTNKAAGMEKEKLSHKEVLEVTNRNKDNFKKILSDLIKRM